MLDYRMEPGTRVVAALKEVRGTGGIWRVDEESLERAVLGYAINGQNVPPEVVQEANIQITEQDKAELIRMALERAFIESVIIEDTTVKDNSNIILSSINIRPDQVPNLPGISITPLDPGEIKEWARRRGDFHYFTFSGFRSEGDRVLVFLTYRCALENWCGSGFTYAYQKKDGRWKGQAVGGYRYITSYRDRSQSRGADLL